MYYVHPKELFSPCKRKPNILTSFVMLLGQHFQPTNDSSNCNMDVHHMTFFFFSSIKMFKDEELCALSHHWVEPPLTMSYAFIQGSWFAYQKKWFEAILLFKFFQLWIERAQIFQIFPSFWGKKNSLKINKFQD